MSSMTNFDTPRIFFFGWVCWSPIPHWYKLIPWSMTAVKKNWCQSCLYDQWLVDSEPIFDPPWVIDKPSRYCHGQVRTSGTCTSGPGWATGGLLVGVCWVGYRWSKFGNGSKPMVFIFVYILCIYIYIYLMGIESKNLDGSAPNPIPSGHQTWLAEKTHLVRGFPTIMFDYQRVCHSKNHIYICTFWYFGLPIWIL